MVFTHVNREQRVCRNVTYEQVQKYNGAKIKRKRKTKGMMMRERNVKRETIAPPLFSGAKTKEGTQGLVAGTYRVLIRERRYVVVQ